ncbi:MAG: DUF1015 domain-containing protein [Desulfobacteraceae bacterium]|nr:DUF1015 domain-containing protein [Desulfobacteraceae bacterium]
MAKIIPFRGILYNPDKIRDISKVITPPFDVISKQEQDEYHESHPQSMIRLILGRKTENDTSDYDWHTRAADSLSQWVSDDMLVQDDLQAFYVTSVEFPMENRMVTRFGMIALVGLEPFENGVVLPHERTFSRVKSERLELMKKCHTNFSPIFSLYSDGNGIFNMLKKSIDGKTPDMDFTDNSDHRHKLWRVTDPDIHKYVTDAMKDKKIFIADGHHRYETALNYKRWVSETNPDFPDDHPANYVMMYLCSMEDPGMVILPAHRLITDISSAKLTEFVKNTENYFDAQLFSFEGNGYEKARDEFISALSSNNSTNTVGVFVKNRPEFHLLKLKPDVMETLFSNEIPEALIDIDVTVLTRLIFMEILGFNNARLDNDKLISYSSVAEKAVEAVNTGDCDVAFILNPTKIEQVKKIAEQGLIMPRKATYFYPKVITGQVINRLTIDD